MIYYLCRLSLSIIVWSVFLRHTSVTIKVSTRRQVGWIQWCHTVCLIVRQPEWIAGTVRVSSPPLNSAGPLSILAVISGLWTSVGLFLLRLDIHIPRLQHSLRIQSTERSRWQGWMIFKGYFVQIYWGTTTAKPSLAPQFLFLFSFS